MIQIKQKEALSSRPADDTAWTWSQIRRELELWGDPEKGCKPVPDHLLFVTNVPLSPYPDAGGHDQIQTSIANYRAELADAATKFPSDKQKHQRISQIKSIRVWDGNQLQVLLSVHEGVRRSIPGFLTGPDVFAALAQFTDRISVDELERHAEGTRPPHPARRRFRGLRRGRRRAEGRADP